MATYHCDIKTGSIIGGASGIAKANYVCREGKYKDRPDLEGKAWHGNMPSWAQDAPMEFWKAADENERANGRIYTEIELALPREITAEYREAMVKEFVAEQLAGHPYTFAVHCPNAAIEGGKQPHAHIIFSERELDGIDRDREQFFLRPSAPYRLRKTKKMVPADPTKGGAGKSKDWNKRGKVQLVREAWEEHYNRASSIPVSCKSLKAQGIDREAEPHLGPLRAKTATEVYAIKKRRTAPDRLADLDTHIADLGHQIESLEREILRDEQKAESARLATEKAVTEQIAAEKDAESAKWFAEAHARIDKYKAAALAAAQEQPTTVLSEPAAVIAIVPQLRQEVVSVVSEAPSEALLPLTDKIISPSSKPAVLPESVELPVAKKQSRSGAGTVALPPEPERDPAWYLRCLEQINALIRKWKGSKEEDREQIVAEIDIEVKKSGHSKISLNANGPTFLDGKAMIIRVGDERKRLGIGPTQTKGNTI